MIVQSYLVIPTENSSFSGSLNHTILVFWKYLLWPFLIPGISYFIWKGTPDDKRLEGVNYSRTAPVLLAAALIHALISNVAYYLTLIPFIGVETAASLISEFSRFFFVIYIDRLLEAIAVTAIVIGILFYQNYTQKQLLLSEMREKVREVELHALRNQLNPHFLFNMLNTISALIDQNTVKAQKVLSKVSSLLRKLLSESNKELVLFSEDLELTKLYLDLEGERFPDRLAIHYEIDQKLLDVQVPGLMIQPIVENTIKHAVSITSEKIQLNISASLDQEFLAIVVRDNGPGAVLERERTQSNGVGLKNLKERLEMLYNGRAKFLVDSDGKTFFKVEIQIPIIR